MIKRSDGATLYMTRDLAAALIEKKHMILRNRCMLSVVSSENILCR